MHVNCGMHEIRSLNIPSGLTKFSNFVNKRYYYYYMSINYKKEDHLIKAS